MKNCNLSFILLFSISFFSTIAVSANSGNVIINFDYLKALSVNVIKFDSKDVKIEKITHLANDFLLMYTIYGDTKSLYVMSHNKKTVDTLNLQTSNNVPIVNNNLAIYELSNSNKNQYIQIFCGKDTTYTTIIQNRKDLNGFLYPISKYKLGKIMGLSFNKEKNIVNAMFMSNSSLLQGKDDNTYKVLYSVSSTPYSTYWTLPEFISKHNNVEFNHYSFGRHYTKNRTTGYSIISQKNDGSAYLSESSDNGETWSYPSILNDKLNGKGHKIFINKNMVYIMFFKPISQGSNINDMYIWFGNIKDLKHNTGNGEIFKVTDNARYKGYSESDVKKINSLMNFELIKTKYNNIFILVSAKWEINKPNYTIGLIIDETILKEGSKN